MSLSTEPKPQTRPAPKPRAVRNSRVQVWWAHRPAVVRTFVWGRAALALFLAVLLWGYVTNTYDPQQPQTYRDVKVNVVGLPSDLVVVQPPESVEVRFLATLTVRDTLSTGDFSLSVDVHDAQPGSPTLAVQVDKKPNVSNIEIIPPRVSVGLEKRISLVMPVNLKPIAPQVGYTLGATTLSPSSVIVTGPESAVNKVRSVLIDLSQLNPQGDIDETLSPLPLDASGNTVTDVTLDPPQVHVHIPVNLKIGYKTVPINLNIRGVPASGYAAVAVTTDMSSQTINLYGDPADLAAVKSIQTDPIDITGATTDVVRGVGLVKVPNVTFLANPRITVTVRISQAQTSTVVNVRVEAENANPDLDVTFAPPTITVTLNGPYQDVQNLPRIRAVVDVAGRGSGSYQVQPVIEDAGTLTVSAPPTISVTLAERPTATPEPTPTLLPTLPPTRIPTLPTNTPAPSSPTFGAATATSTPPPTTTAPAPTPRVSAPTPPPAPTTAPAAQVLTTPAPKAP